MVKPLQKSDNQNMKKLISVLLLLSTLNVFLFSVEIPENLYGIWEGKDRFVFFDNNSATNDPEISVYLKEYYGWYIDRTAEPEVFSEKQNRTRNSGTTREAVNLILGFNQINKNQLPEDQNAPEPYAYKNAFEIEIQYSKSQKNLIPVAILEDKLYLDFYIQDTENPNLYRGNINSKGLLVSEQIIPENIGLYYLDRNKNIIYNIRYWQTDMDYEASSVLYSKNGNEFYVDKHLISGGRNFSCVSGRSKKIRNPVEGKTFMESDYIFSSDNSLLITDKEPYLYRLADHKTLDDLFEIVKKQNSRRKPDPEPLFPPDDLNWHWDLIEILEKNNAIIQEVRERQKAFGSRGH